MKFISPVSDLRRALPLARRAVKGRTTLPVLSCLMLSLKGGHLTISGTNLDQQVDATIPVDQHAEGVTCVSATKLHEICETLPSEKVTVSLVEGRLEILCGRSRLRLATLDLKEWHDMKPGGCLATIPISMEDLTAVFSVEYATLPDTLFAMSRVSLKLGGATLSAEATDGRRMAHAERQVLNSNASFDVGLPNEFIKLIAALPETDADCVLSVGGNSIESRTVHDGLSCRVISKLDERKPVRFPDAPFTQHATVSRQELLQAIRQTEIYCDQNFARIALIFSENKITVSIQREGEGCEPTVDCKCDLDRTLYLNPHYFSQTLNAIDSDTVAISKHAEHDVLKLTGEPDSGVFHILQTMIA